MKSSKSIDNQILDILSTQITIARCSLWDWQVVLNTGQLVPKVYKATDEVLTRLGGKWNKKTRSHLFSADPTQTLQAIISSGVLPPSNPAAYYCTSDELAAKLVRPLSNIKPSDGVLRILEPSGGTGAIARALRAHCLELGLMPDEFQIDVVELLPNHQEILRQQGFNVVAANFLGYRPIHFYHWIGMNPPFSIPGDAMAWRTHLQHARSMLAPDGQLVAILPDSISPDRCGQIADLYMDLIRHGEINQNPKNAFKAAGTLAATCSIYLENDDISWQRHPFQDAPNWHVWTFRTIADNDYDIYCAEASLTERLRADNQTTVLDVKGHLLPGLKAELAPHYRRLVDQAIRNGIALEPTPEDWESMFATFEPVLN